MPALSAVAAVAMVIVILLILNSPAHTSGAGPALLSPPGPRTPTAPAVSPSASTSPSAARPSHHPSPKATVPVNQPSATASARPAVIRLPVTVLNNSRIYHLAARAAGELRAGGWPIAKVGNFTGRIITSTVYYAPGQAGAAEALARQFPRVRRVLPRFRGLPGQGLTLVVTRDWDP